MVEEPDTKFPPIEENSVDHEEDPDETAPDEGSSAADEVRKPNAEQDCSRVEPTEDLDEPMEDHHVDTPFVVSSSTGSDGETTGPSTAENSVSQAPPPMDSEPKQVVGGRASIPDELEPHQLARLQDLKESNA